MTFNVNVGLLEMDRELAEPIMWLSKGKQCARVHRLNTTIQLCEVGIEHAICKGISSWHNNTVVWSRYTTCNMQGYIVLTQLYCCVKTIYNMQGYTVLTQQYSCVKTVYPRTIVHLWLTNTTSVTHLEDDWTNVDFCWSGFLLLFIITNGRRYAEVC